MKTQREIYIYIYIKRQEIDTYLTPRVLSSLIGMSLTCSTVILGSNKCGFTRTLNSALIAGKLMDWAALNLDKAPMSDVAEEATSSFSGCVSSLVTVLSPQA